MKTEIVNLVNEIIELDSKLGSMSFLNSNYNEKMKKLNTIIKDEYNINVYLNNYSKGKFSGRVEFIDRPEVCFTYELDIKSGILMERNEVTKEEVKIKL